MSFTKINATASTLTKNRTEGSIVPISGMCVTCVDGCIGMCEIGKSAYRGVETIYPQPFGIISSASEKNYPVDLSHFTILGSCVGAHGIAADPDKAIFTNVNLEQSIGHDKGIKLKLPFVIPGLGSTAIAKNNWEGLAIGAAISGMIVTIGENICGMDPKSEMKNGRIFRSPEMEKRVNLFKNWQQDGYGTIVVQTNVEDTRIGVHEYVIEKLGVQVAELKWGQGAKDIGGEVKIKDLKHAQMLKDRGYIVLPDPYDPDIIKAFEQRIFHEFERHSRIGMVEMESFIKRAEELRKAGAKYVFLKTGAYRPRDLALAVKCASEAKIDLLTVDGAGGGTAMSPWRMMCEWGVPGVELWSLLYQYLEKMNKKGKHIPDVALAGGFILEDQIFKGFALGAPYVKLIGMARGPLAAAMVGKNIGKRIEEESIPVYVERFGNSIEEIFITAPELKRKYGEDFEKLPPGAIGLYTYMKRIEQGLKQLMCGSRKFALKYFTRDDIAALTQEAANISGIPYIMDADREEAEKLLN
ncbi:MAG: FMN-binding glutamate synthase family protein [Bacteroidetes bacterium]|nr:FMN-binding glutamate synthase family protein [Bacteroidota bacterium]MBU1423032.1 FMN-binding glutamate synthase family protein [Bacteroidota bacterium]MBU2472057.1 FMN-binding glutamate synthase family protein [Bacteroidota bacterium]MBU2637072.1 FMN-binding glutamate synthase family protein [Bacteroidota bacterium]